MTFIYISEYKIMYKILNKRLINDNHLNMKQCSLLCILELCCYVWLPW